MSCVLLTGATGFIGRQSAAKLSEKGYDIVAAVRHLSDYLPTEARQVVVGDLASAIDWTDALNEVSTVIHTAARVHVMKDAAINPLHEFRRVNLEATVSLAEQAIAAGVKRFVYLSSIKVNGENSRPGIPFTADDLPNPEDDYAVSKAEAEFALLKLAATTDMEIVIIRPVLVYGPDVKANFLNMMRWLNNRIPLPFGAIYNKRSLIALDNIVDLIITCMEHPAAANQIFLASDDYDVSTTELLRKVGSLLGKPARLIPVSMVVLCSVAKLLGKGDVAKRLFGSLEVDITKTKELLNWQPPVNMEEAINMTAQDFLLQQRIKKL